VHYKAGLGICTSSGALTNLSAAMVERAAAAVAAVAGTAEAYLVIPCTAKLALAFSCDGSTSLAAAAALL